MSGWFSGRAKMLMINRLMAQGRLSRGLTVEI